MIAAIFELKMFSSSTSTQIQDLPDRPDLWRNSVRLDELESLPDFVN